MRLSNCYKFFSVLLLLVSCDQGKENSVDAEVQYKAPKRVGMVTGIEPEKIEYYKKLHAETWDGVLKKIKESNIRNFSIYIKKIENKYYLFSYYEYLGNNYEEDMKKIAADSTTQRWWRETDPCQIPLPEAAAEGKIWTTMEEVFHTE